MLSARNTLPDLKNAIEQERIARLHFQRTPGIGKTTVARILAMSLNCRSAAKPMPEPCGICESCTEIRAGNAVDVIEIDAATNRGIDEIRELREAARYLPARDRFKIYILDAAHQITDAAFNALLKTLEEPPSHVVFMLATTQPEDIPQTIRSRCQHFSFRAVKFTDILGQLRDLTRRENIPADEDALALLAEAGDGSIRDALSILDQAIASTADHLTLDSVRRLIGAAPAGALEAVMQGVADGSSERFCCWSMSDQRRATRPFARQLVRFCGTLRWQKLRARTRRCFRFLRMNGDGRRGPPICSARKVWRGICKSCCARMANSAIGRISASIWNSACSRWRTRSASCLWSN
jgi:DNA polymerase-3 subunit gamma/tau